MSEKFLGTPPTKPKVLVYGWYHKNNIGDDLFADAFRHIFPEFDFTFVDSLVLSQVEKCDAIFFGGGSFLYDEPSSTKFSLNLVRQKKIFYIGVGVETVINSVHQELMSSACLIATRSAGQVERLKNINPNSMYIPDLVFALRDKVVLSEKVPNSVLIIPNVLVVPQVSGPHWQHSAWAHFKTEFCQFLDGLVKDKCQIKFWPMCTNAYADDTWAASELIAHMDKRRNSLLLPPLPSDFAQITKLISSFELVITQRFHGIVLSELCKTPYISIHHHDKLKSFQSDNGTLLSYYSSAKQDLIDKFRYTQTINYSDILPIETNIFKDLKRIVLSHIK